MYEDLGFTCEKLAACIFAALRWPSNDHSVVAAWDENQHTVSALIQMSLHKYEKAVVERTVGLQPDEQARLRKMLEQERLDMQRQRELGGKQKKWEAARVERQKQSPMHEK